MSQPFGYLGCENALEKIVNIVKDDLKSWNTDRPVPLHEEMMKIAINIITKTNFGCHFQEKGNSARLLEGYTKVFKDFDDALLGFWSFGLGDDREKEFQENLKKFKDEIKLIVNT